MENETRRELALGSDMYKSEATKGIIVQIIKIIFFILCAVALVFINVRYHMYWSDINPVIPAAIIMLLNCIGPFIRFFGKFKLVETNTRTGEVTGEQTLGCQGFVAIIILSVVLFLLGSFTLYEPRFRFMVILVSSLVILFGIIYPVVNSILTLITYIKVRKSAKKVNVAYDDTTTEDVCIKGFTVVAWFRYITVRVCIVLIIVAVLICIPQGKKAQKYEETLDIDACIMEADMGDLDKEEIKENLVSNGDYNVFYTKYSIMGVLTETENGQTVHKDYELTFTYDKKADEWKLDDYDVWYAFILWSTHEDFEQGGLFEGKGKLLDKKGEADVLLTFNYFDTTCANGILKLTYNDKVLETEFESTSIEEVKKEFLFKDVSYTVEYIIKLDKPFDEEDKMKVIYDVDKDTTKLEYMGETVLLERYDGEK